MKKRKKDTFALFMELKSVKLPTMQNKTAERLKNKERREENVRLTQEAQ